MFDMNSKTNQNIKTNESKDAHEFLNKLSLVYIYYMLCVVIYALCGH